LDFGPHVGMGLDVFLYHFAVVPQFKGLAITFHIVQVKGYRLRVKGL
jgi:hypothetical protein